MSILDSLTPEIIGIILAIVVPFGGAMFWLGMLTHKLNSLEDNVKKLQGHVEEISIKFNADLLARRELSKLGSGEHKNE
jgi:hypothetical protein